MDLWLVFQKPINFGPWKFEEEKMDFEILFEKILMRIFIWQLPTAGTWMLSPQKEEDFKMQFKNLKNPMRIFIIFYPCSHIGFAYWGSQNLKQETQLKCEKASPWEQVLNSFFHTPKIMTTSMICHLENFLGRHINLCKIKLSCTWGSKP